MAGARLAAVFSMALLSACASLPPPAPHAISGHNAFLWHAETPGRGELYLLGSMHAGHAPIVLAGDVDVAWRQAASLVLELDLLAIDAKSGAEVLVRRGRLQGRALSDVVEASTWQSLVAFGDAHGFDANLLQSSQPWFAAMTVEEIQMRNAGLVPDYGVEAALRRRADREDRPIEALETLDEQLGAFADLPFSVQEQLLRDVLSPRMPEDLLRFAEAWKTGDEPQLAGMIFSDGRDARTPLYESLFFARNARMAERLHAMAGDGRRVSPWWAPATS